MNHIKFMSRMDAMFYQPKTKAVLISIHDESETELQPNGKFEDILWLKFHDTDSRDGVLTAFSDEHAKWICSFLKKHKDIDEVVVHCTMGVSRSAAVAIFLSEYNGVQCYRNDLKVDYSSWPRYNRLVYRTSSSTTTKKTKRWNGVKSARSVASNSMATCGSVVHIATALLVSLTTTSCKGIVMIIEFLGKGTTGKGKKVFDLSNATDRIRLGEFFLAENLDDWYHLKCDGHFMLYENITMELIETIMFIVKDLKKKQMTVEVTYEEWSLCSPQELQNLLGERFSGATT